MSQGNLKFTKFIIFAPSYSPDSGGIAVLHRLCHMLNENGYEATLYPSFKTVLIHKGFWIKPLLSSLAAALKNKYFRPYKTKPGLNTPVFFGSPQELRENYVVIYSEGVHGNPLGAKHVVRWLLHKPGYNYGLTCFGNGELVVSYNQSYSKDFSLPLSRISKTLLYIPFENLSHYGFEDALSLEHRTGVAYCLRKGKSKPRVHVESDAILIDGLAHEEIASIFKRVKTFISYDSKTAYSIFASVCGADSVIIPDPGVSLEDWEPEEDKRYGLSYGFENIEWARKTRSLMLKEIQNSIHQSVKQMHAFVEEANSYFPVDPFR
jgi:hypothetical protein